MSTLPRTYNPPTDFGLVATVLGTIGLILSILPVLSIPLSACGLLCGLIGLAIALWRKPEDLRWSVAGVAMSGLALAVAIGLAYAPEGYLQRKVPQLWQSVPDRPYVAPPQRETRGG
jgi:hypothetical protein